VSFEDALQNQLPPDRIGEVRLRFDENILIGAREPRRGLWPEVGGVLALGAGIVAVVFLVQGGSLLAAGALALLSAALTGFSIAARGRLRGPTRFILNFATESLRLDAPDRLGRTVSEVVPFDSVRELTVVPTAPRHFGLLLEYTDAAQTPRRAYLVQQSPAAEVEELRRAWRILRHAFGL
jgi:hypothetical protein